MTSRESTWRVVSVLGAILGYGCLAAFLGLIGTQLYRWLKAGEWTRVSLADGIRSVLSHMPMPGDSTARLARLAHWLDAPVDWLGLHKLIEVLPASLALFSIAVLGNFLFIYGSDRLRDYRPRS
ncbi:MAG TPA: hypothetical protein VHY75_15565 [Steroidobacteraceae bacterium]|nr:hypothetical protein [Steroidobacteraceae bacterium]